MNTGKHHGGRTDGTLNEERKTAAHSGTAAELSGSDRQPACGTVQSIEGHDPERHIGAQKIGLSDTDIVAGSGRRDHGSRVRTAEIPAEIIAEYTCSICGITILEHKNWGPTCPRTQKKVCDCCCFRCEHHLSWSGVWRCAYITPEQRRENAKKKAQERFDQENLRISRAYHEKRKEEARQRAIKQARAKARKERNPGGRY